MVSYPNKTKTLKLFFFSSGGKLLKVRSSLIDENLGKLLFICRTQHEQIQNYLWFRSVKARLKHTLHVHETELS